MYSNTSLNFKGFEKILEVGNKNHHRGGAKGIKTIIIELKPTVESNHQPSTRRNQTVEKREKCGD